MWVLEIKLRSSARSTRALTHGANSPAHIVLDITLVLFRDRTHVTLKLTRQLRTTLSSHPHFQSARITDVDHYSQLCLMKSPYKRILLGYY